MALTDQAFEDIFTAHHETLYRYAFSILRDEASAEEAVSAVFCRLWQKRAQLPADAAQLGYIYTAVHHEAMDQLKHEEIRKRHTNYLVYRSRQIRPAAEAAHRAELNEFQRLLLQAFEKLPDQCRLVFHLSRVEQLSHKDIAARLGLSVKTVETQVGRALKRLRVALADYLPLLIIGYVAIAK